MQFPGLELSLAEAHTIQHSVRFGMVLGLWAEKAVDSPPRDKETSVT